MPAATARRPASERPFVVGVVSDTHGHLYPRVARLLEGVDHIIHAGDVGSAEVLRALRSIAPRRSPCGVTATSASGQTPCRPGPRWNWPACASW